MSEELVHEGAFDAPADRVWELLREFQGADVPQVLADRVEREGDGVGSKRTIRWITGAWVTEQLEECDDDRKVLRYRVVGAPNRDRPGALTRVTVTETRPDKCFVQWRRREPEDKDRAARPIVRDVFVLFAQALEERLREPGSG